MSKIQIWEAVKEFDLDGHTYKPGDECPDCGAPGFECMGEHDTYAAAKEHDEQVADGMAPTYEHDALPF